jgi:hypothetical protein
MLTIVTEVITGLHELASGASAGAEIRNSPPRDSECP